jgi:uncharacterized membrane protein
MEEALVFTAEKSALAINAMALVVIVIGAVEAFVGGFRAMLFAPGVGHENKGVWLRFARWLVVGLTFQLAADIIETSIAPTWQDIGQLAAIAAIRTALNYFLERDINEMGDEDQGRPLRAE